MTSMKNLRQNVEPVFTDILEKSSEHCDVSIMPRTCSKQKNRSNADVDDAAAYHRISIFIPFLESTISQLENGFSNHVKASTLGFLIPKNISNGGSE